MKPNPKKLEQRKITRGQCGKQLLPDARENLSDQGAIGFSFASEKNGPLPPLFIFASVVCKRLLAKKDILSNFCILSAQVEAERMKRAAVLKSEGKKKKR